MGNAIRLTGTEVCGVEPSELGLGFDVLDFSREPWPPGPPLKFRHLSYFKTGKKSEKENSKKKIQKKNEKRGTLRSMLERVKRKGLNSGSLWIDFQFPLPYLATPALNASSSSAVHFCFGFPISLSLQRCANHCSALAAAATAARAAAICFYTNGDVSAFENRLNVGSRGGFRAHNMPLFVSVGH